MRAAPAIAAPDRAAQCGERGVGEGFRSGDLQGRGHHEANAAEDAKPSSRTGFLRSWYSMGGSTLMVGRSRSHRLSRPGERTPSESAALAMQARFAPLVVHNAPPSFWPKSRRNLQRVVIRNHGRG
jgi:hypothetical protein